MASRKKLSVDFEVFGRVQGVFFRKYTQKTATGLGLTGWVQNTIRGTVIGTTQGSEASVRTMKEWLRKTGSPKSRIERCVFKNEQTISSSKYKDFTVVK